jgi:hypothetical protein
MIPDLDSINVLQKDSSEVVFEMSPDYKAPNTPPVKDNVIRSEDNVNLSIALDNRPIKSNEAMNFRSLVANVQGNSVLDVGHAQIGYIKLNIADSSGIILSGNSLKKVHFE